MTSTGAKDVPESINTDDVFLLLAELFGGSLHEGYWDSPSDDSTLPEAALRLTDVMIEKMGVGPGDRVLDIGCGIGAPAIRLARSTGASVLGITSSTRQAELAGKNTEDAGVGDRVTFQCADAMDLPFPANSFDAAWLIESIFVMPDRLAVLSQAARVLKPGGRLALTDLLEQIPAADTLRKAAEKLDAHGSAQPLTRLLPIPIEEYPPLLERAGLIPVEISDITEHTVARTFACMWQRLRDDREFLVEKFGGPIIELYESTLPLLEAADWGYAIVVATVPARRVRPAVVSPR